MAPYIADRATQMSLERFRKDEHYKHVCPFCLNELLICDNDYFKKHDEIGYECGLCSIPDVNTISGKPYSKYNIGVMQYQQLGVRSAEQLIVEETFYIHNKENRWYLVHNDLIKDRTTVVLTVPMTEKLLYYAGEKPVGVAWISGIQILPLIDSWNLLDEPGTLRRIKTYIIFS